MEIVQAVKKLNSISRERLNFRRRPILCTTLYRNPMQASNFGGTFDQLFLRLFFIKFSQMPLYLFYTMVQKSQKWPKTQIKGGGPALKGVTTKALSFKFMPWSANAVVLLSCDMSSENTATNCVACILTLLYFFLFCFVLEGIRLYNYNVHKPAHSEVLPLPMAIPSLFEPTFACKRKA